MLHGFPVPGGFRVAVDKEVPAPSYVAPYLDADLVFGVSTRLLRPGYAGSCMRVRRIGDNVEQDIGFASGVLDTAALSLFLGVSEGRIVTWYDQSGNGRDVTNATATGQPQILASASPAGKPGAQFFASGNYDTLAAASTTPVGDYTLNAAASWDGTAAIQALAATSRAGFPGLMFATDGSLAVGTGETPTAAAVAGGVGWRYASGSSSSAGSETIIVDGSALNSGTGTAWTTADVIRIGASRSTGNYPMRGRIAEYAWLTSGRSEATRRADIANMTAFFGS